MKKDVLVSISGLQFEIDKEETVEVISVGEYYITRCTLKISDKQVSIQKKGANNVHMIFEVNRKNVTYYSTPFGDLQIGINTTSIKVTEEEEQILANIKYELDINYSHVSDCEIQIKITSRKGGK